MTSSQSSALVKRNLDSTLMPPPPKRQKRPATVLEEDVYSNALSHIIARDFFPGLLETEAQQEYMEALESKDSSWVKEAGRKLTQIMTPGPDGRRKGRRGTTFATGRSPAQSETPRTFVGDTPQRTPTTTINDDFAPENPPEVDWNLSLGAFQAKYTSEDNESFNALLDKQNEKHAAKYTFFHHGNKIPSARQIAYRAMQSKLSEDGASSSALITNAASDDRIAVSASGPSQDLDARPASVDNFPDRQGPRNSFMFGPDSIEDRMTTHQQEAEQKSNAPTRVVKYSATRFQARHEPVDTVPPSPSLSAIDAAIAGRPKATASESGYPGSETPRVRGYAFVDEEPTPSELGMPVTDDEVDMAEQETAKQFLPKLDEDGPGRFSIAERSKREDLHHRLVEKADVDRRKGGRLEQLQSLGITSGRTPTPRHAGSPCTKKGANMTPAARRLADKIRTPRSGGMMSDKPSPDTRSGVWTPTPRSKRSF